ncbi:hypothetical protein KN811_09965 [Sinomicrobium sp. 2019215]|uniref:hypothetical protein n=1 Tax=Sinomicrobium weinanense TaxID=2842200 RepID=UPI001C0DC2F3|nr:hypothetical protein [Sinomicrobium weinanense]MBU3123726.1 hypothetical protein [Sinomicrobium weinanense]
MSSTVIRLAVNPRRYAVNIIRYVMNPTQYAGNLPRYVVPPYGYENNSNPVSGTQNTIYAKQNPSGRSTVPERI